ncbi:hypothetical protein WN55_07912 [Dufourea novaeangliae]|uniref:Transposable element Tc3 transposase n=1 Tax=Dufourea novaeangliae TaxID=178035 RepID=A0A154P6L8_DUFNO|nr:hypothetical protein WN55_07912 [Dufourea novaeangliae]
MMWLQHDGCPTHYARRVRDALNKLYPNKWIGRGGFISWSPRSPDSTPLDFFLWGALKNAVYQKIPTVPENMKQQIITACARINSETIRHARDAVCVTICPPLYRVSFVYNIFSYDYKQRQYSKWT